MVRQIRLWMLGMLSLVGVSMATYAYALSCGDGLVEILDMQLISVAYDGMTEVEPPEYAGVKGSLTVLATKRFFKNFPGDSRNFYAE